MSAWICAASSDAAATADGAGRRSAANSSAGMKLRVIKRLLLHPARLGLIRVGGVGYEKQLHVGEIGGGERLAGLRFHALDHRRDVRLEGARPLRLRFRHRREVFRAGVRRMTAAPSLVS